MGGGGDPSRWEFALNPRARGQATGNLHHVSRNTKKSALGFSGRRKPYTALGMRKRVCRYLGWDEANLTKGQARKLSRLIGPI
jgi:hypothetical protein